MAALFVVCEQAQEFQVWPHAGPIPAGTIHENGTYFFELRDADDPLGADLFVDDESLEALRVKRPGLAKWRWSPGFNAGVVECTLRLSGRPRITFEITTDADVRKLTRDQFDTMLREILLDTFALFNLSAFRKGFSRGTGSRPPAIARLEFLRSRAEQIDTNVRAIARNPRRLLIGDVVSKPYWQVKRLTGPEILRSFRMGRAVPEQGSPSRLPKPLRGHLPSRIFQRQASHSLNTPENRTIKACLLAWSSWLASVADTLQRTADTEPESQTINQRWADRTRKMSRQFTDLLSLPFFAEVEPTYPRPTMSAVFRNDSAYRKFFRLYQDMQMGITAVFGDFLQMPLARTFDLYELWCFLRIVHAAALIFGKGSIDVSSLFLRDKNDRLTLATGTAVAKLGNGYTLFFQRNFKEYWLSADGRGSYSREMQPDFSLFQNRPPAKDRIIVLDAKYRVDEGLNDALSSIHMYRDALVEQAENSGIRGVVEAAYLIAPFVPLTETSFKDTRLPSRLFHPDYRSTFKFGALSLRPGTPLPEIATALRALIDDATQTKPADEG